MAPSSIRPAYERPGLASLRASVGSSAVRWLPSSWLSCSLEAVCLALTSSLRSSPSLASAQLPCWAQKPKDEPSNTPRRYKDRAKLMILCSLPTNCVQGPYAACQRTAFYLRSGRLQGRPPVRQAARKTSGQAGCKEDLRSGRLQGR